MTQKNNRYMLQGVDFSNVLNRNEVRLLDEMRAMLEEPGMLDLSEKELLDIYAFALNLLPARYAQFGTIILRDPVKKEHIREALERALKIALTSPKP